MFLTWIFRALADAVPDLIGLAAMDGSTRYVNPAGLALLKLEGVDVAGKPVADYVAEHKLPAFGEVMGTVMRDGQWAGEMEFRCADGTLFPGGQVIAVVRDPGGQSECIATIVRDMRPYKQLEEVLRQSIRELSTPIIEVWEGVLALPVVGVLDSGRAAQMMDSFLRAVVEKDCKISVIDLTGVEVMDTSTLDHLFKLVRAASLLGSRCVISGISPKVAQTVSSLGIDLANIATFRSLRDALRFAMRHTQAQAPAARQAP